MLLGMQKFLKRNWKQASEATNQYLNGVQVNIESFNKTSAFMQDNIKRGIQGDALDAAVKDASTDVREGLVLTGIASERIGSQNISDISNELRKMTDKNGMINVTGFGPVAGIRQARGITPVDDLKSVGAIAAAGVVGFSAVSGTVNLID